MSNFIYGACVFWLHVMAFLFFVVAPIFGGLFLLAKLFAWAA